MYKWGQKYMKDYDFLSDERKEDMNRKVMIIYDIINDSLHKPLIKGISWYWMYNENMVRNEDIFMKVVILAGGKGTRISEESQLKPKPMIEIGGMPIIWHIMKTYSYYGFKEFIICGG